MKFLGDKAIIFASLIIIFLLKSVLQKYVNNKRLNSGPLLNFDLDFTQKSLLYQRLFLFDISSIKEILGVREVKGIKQTFFIPEDRGDYDERFNTWSFITIDNNNYYLGATIDKYSDSTQRFHLLKSNVDEAILEWRELLGTNKLVTKYIKLNEQAPIFIAKLSGDVISKDLDNDGIVESIGTVNYLLETTIYIFDLESYRIKSVNLNELTSSNGIRFDLDKNQFKIFKDGLNYVHEYKDRKLIQVRD